MRTSDSAIDLSIRGRVISPSSEKAVQRALVTGAGGFVGKHLCRFLRSQNWDVWGVDRPKATGKSRDIQVCDVTDPAQVKRIIDEVSPTHVFHLAAVTFVPDASRAPEITFHVNLMGTIHVADALLAQAPGARLVFAGSAEAYGSAESLPLREEHPLDPGNPYAISKAASDQYCAYRHETDGLDVLRLRLFNHTGPGQPDRFVLPGFARQVAEIEAGYRPPILRVGNLDALRDFSHVDDVVAAYEAVALKGAAGEAYNVCSGRGVSIRDALDSLLVLSKAAITVERDSERLRAADTPAVVGSHAKLSTATGWKPSRSLEDILESLLGYWRKRVCR